MIKPKKVMLVRSTTGFFHNLYKLTFEEDRWQKRQLKKSRLKTNQKKSREIQVNE